MDLKNIPFVGPVVTGGEFLFNLATGKNDPVPAPPQSTPGMDLQQDLQDKGKEAVTNAGQAIKEAGETVFNGVVGAYDGIKKYAPLAVAGLAGLIILKAVKK